MQNECSICGGSGKVVYHDPPEPERYLGNGLTVEDMGGISTRACECVRDLPPIEGDAAWWDLEEIYSDSITAVALGCEIDVKCEVEVPRTECGRRVHRTKENFYYPTFVGIESREKVMLLPSEAREYAAILIAAAEACEAADRLED